MDLGLCHTRKLTSSFPLHHPENTYIIFNLLFRSEKRIVFLSLSRRTSSFRRLSFSAGINIFPVSHLTRNRASSFVYFFKHPPYIFFGKNPKTSSFHRVSIQNRVQSVLIGRSFFTIFATVLSVRTFKYLYAQ